MHLSTELQKIGADRLVKCEVLKVYNMGGDGFAHVGAIVHIDANTAGQLVQENYVRVQRNKAGAIDTAVNPDYQAPQPPATARIRITIATNLHPVGEKALRRCEVGEVLEVTEDVAAQLCGAGNPSAVRVA